MYSVFAMGWNESRVYSASGCTWRLRELPSASICSAIYYRFEVIFQVNHAFDLIHLVTL